jgi:outer membrane protein assembly factor BamA
MPQLMSCPPPPVPGARATVCAGGSVELTHENLFGDSQSLSVSLSSSDWRNPAADLGFQMSYTEPFYAKNTTRNVQVRWAARLL